MKNDRAQRFEEMKSRGRGKVAAAVVEVVTPEEVKVVLAPVEEKVEVPVFTEEVVAPKVEEEVVVTPTFEPVKVEEEVAPKPKKGGKKTTDVVNDGWGDK